MALTKSSTRRNKTRIHVPSAQKRGPPSASPPKPPPLLLGHISILPPELIILIIESLALREILALLKTCKKMRNIAEAHIYKAISLPAHRKDGARTLIRTLALRPDLARITTSFSGFICPFIPPDPSSSRQNTPEDVTDAISRMQLDDHDQVEAPAPVVADDAIDIEQFGKNLSEVLGSMSSLQSLSLRDFEEGWWPEGYSILRNVVAPQLSLTRLQVCSAYGTFPGTGEDGLERIAIRGELLLFLRAQPSIESLELPMYGVLRGQPLLPTDLPHLKTLTCGPSDARILASGRPVGSLTVGRVPGNDIRETWAGISKAPITTLTISQPKSLGLNLKAIAMRLRVIKTLTILGLSDGDVNQLRRYLPLFSHLLRLTLRVYPKAHGEVEQRIRWESVRLACPNIDEINVQFDKVV